MSDGQEPSPEALQEILRTIGRHCVAYTGEYIYLDEKKEPVGDVKFFAISGFVIEIGNHWFIATAGHCVRIYEQLAKHPGVRILSRGLADFFGTDAVHNHSIPCSLLEEDVGWVYEPDNGLDYALIRVDGNKRKLLEANGIIPLDPSAWASPDREFEAYHLFGFPEERTDPSTTAFGGYVQPILMPLERLPDDTSKTYSRWSGKILNLGGLESVKGFSGGPIFGMRTEGDRYRYFAVAIQSHWNEVDTVYACPIATFMNIIIANFRKKREQEKKPE